jgi:hypothetical protein
VKFVLVAGGRKFEDRDFVWRMMDRAKTSLPSFVVVTGACPSGADLFAEQWAKSRQQPYIGVPAKWFVHGEAAGPLRNREMLDMWKIDYGVIFPGGSGTRHMAELLEKAKVQTWRLDKPKTP